jgi:hypothetical protein
LNQKKRHHYLAQTYLEGFCNPDGKVCVYLKDRPGAPWWAAVNTIGFENYYYSQPTPDGGQDNNLLEDSFSSFENRWPDIVSKVESKDQLGEHFKDMLSFIIMHRVRVPTARDAVEATLAESVRMTARFLNDCGKLPAPPEGITFDDLDKHLVVSIDPHRSILAMTDLATGVAKIIDAIGFEILENHTPEGFITSDNPVIYFDPTASLALLEPYNISRSRMDIEFMFPIAPRFLLWGHSAMACRPDRHAPKYQHIRDLAFVRRANALAVRFANRMVFSNEDRHQELVERYGRRSPVLSVTHLRTSSGRGIRVQHTFSSSKPKPKWSAQKPGRQRP